MFKVTKKYLESLSEGIICFNHNGAVDYLNTSAGKLLWGENYADDYYQEITDIVRNLTPEEINLSHIAKPKALHNGVSIIYTVYMLNGCKMLIFNDNFDINRSDVDMKYAIRCELIFDRISGTQSYTNLLVNITFLMKVRMCQAMQKIKINMDLCLN